MTATLQCDGSCNPNPGQMGIGGILEIDGQLYTYSEKVGEGTNNVAEYLSLAHGMQIAKDRGVKVLDVQMDSKLVVLQVCKKWKVNNLELRTHWEQIQALIPCFESVNFKWIPREENTHADQLSTDKPKKFETVSSGGTMPAPKGHTKWGGRQAGTPNKTTSYLRDQITEADPVQFLIEVMRGEHGAELDQRLHSAKILIRKVCPDLSTMRLEVEGSDTMQDLTPEDALAELEDLKALYEKEVINKQRHNLPLSTKRN